MIRFAGHAPFRLPFSPTISSTPRPIAGLTPGRSLKATLACFAVLSTLFLTLAGLLMSLGQH
jgi:hypothetical protein